MSRGTFRGTWETTHGVPVLPVAVVLGGAALLSWLLTVLAALLWLLVALAVLFVAASAAGVIWMRRWNRRPAPRWVAAFPDDEPRPAVTTVQPPVIQHFHGGTHLHLTPGAGSAGHPLVIPARDAITEREE